MANKKSNWADKYNLPKAQTGQNIPATRKDSLALKNSSQRLLKDLKGKGYEYVKDTEFSTGMQDKSYNEVENKFKKGSKTTFVQKGSNMLEKATLDPTAYRTKIDNNRYKQKELNHTIINNDIEPELHDRRINGLKLQVLLNKKTGDFINHTDYGFEFKPRPTTSSTTTNSPVIVKTPPKFAYKRGPIEDPKDYDTLSKRNSGAQKILDYGKNDMNFYNKNKTTAQPTLGNLQTNVFKKGGVIKDDRGQWAHPGEITEIGSNRITMQGVNYPVLGISDTGDRQMMYPNEEYKFKGNKVTEFPMAQLGGRFRADLTKKDILTKKGDVFFNKKGDPVTKNTFMEFNDKNYNILNKVGKVAPAVVPIGLGLEAAYNEEDVVNPLNSSKTPVHFKKGGNLKPLHNNNQITNFTTNTSTSKGWMDKYQ